jgi:hypothetical protein
MTVKKNPAKISGISTVVRNIFVNERRQLTLMVGDHDMTYCMKIFMPFLSF